jgi:Ca-activated chloride channel family protein
MPFELTSFVVALALLVVAVPLVLHVTLRVQRRPSVRFSSVARARAAGSSLLARLRHVPLALRLLALACLLVGFARPRTPNARTRVFTEGVAIQMVVDRSSSMNTPMAYKGERKPRFEVVREVFRDFVLGDGKTLKGRPNDLIGLTTFAAFVQDGCPLTLDHENLVAYMDSVDAILPQPAPFADPDDGTAIGDAIYHAVLRLTNAEQELKDAARARGGSAGSRPDYTIKSKIIIMLTDGEQTYGELLPQQAAEFAKKNGIKVYTIGVADRGEVRSIHDDVFGTIPLPGFGIDTRDIEDVAKITGGQFAAATSGEALKAVYERIDRLERSRFREDVRNYDELFDAWWAVPLGFMLLCVEIVARSTVLRQVP